MPETSFSLQFNTLSENESFMMQQKLWRLLARKSRRYTMNDSSSLREETAKELYESLCYLLSLYLEEHRLNINDLLQTDLESVLEQALSIAQNKALFLKMAGRLLRECLPPDWNEYDYFEKTAVELYPGIVRMFGRGVIN